MPSFHFRSVPLRISLLLCTAVILSLLGCASLTPHPCATRDNPVEAKRVAIERTFDRRTIATEQRTWTVYVSRPMRPGRAPILLLHEFPALSADVLDLGERLSRDFNVYIPLLFGAEEDNPQSKLLGFRRGLALKADRLWRIGKAKVHRPIVAQLADLSQKIVEEHDGKNLGAIGMCLTGVLPIALLGQSRDIPQLVAVVVSQPTLPVPSFSDAAKREIGLAAGELQVARQRVTARKLEILGFRFEADKVSPKERFESLCEAFTIGKTRHFVDRTVPTWDYLKNGNLSPRAHSVLTACFREEQAHPRPDLSSTEVAMARLVNFLHLKLDGPSPRAYVERFPERLRQTPSSCAVMASL